MSKPKKGEQPWYMNIVFNVFLPSMILSKLSSPDRLGVSRALILALAFPLGFGIFEAVARKRLNLISVLGFVSTLLTGGMGLLSLDRIWFAVKEAAVPGLIGLAILGSSRTQRPLVKTLFYDEGLLNRDRIKAIIEEKQLQKSFDGLLHSASFHFAMSFFLSAVLNFVLARVLLKSEVGTPAFNQELGRMTALSWPVIVLPSTAAMAFAMWRLLAGLKRLTGLEIGELTQDAASSDVKSAK